MTKARLSVASPQEIPSDGPVAEQPDFCPHVTRSEVRLRYDVLGVEVDAVQIDAANAAMEQWLREFHSSPLAEYRAKVVTFTNVHAVIEARRDPAVGEALSHADMVCPDGIPLVWAGRSRGFHLPMQVSGPEFMKEFFSRTSLRAYSHFFYGGAPGVAESLVQRLQVRNPNLRVAGIYSPPFHQLSEEEDRQQVDLINATQADMLWVALGCPKQELWMQAHRGRLRVGIMLGVGQAFDIHSGRIKQAPHWMRAHGLEWLYRLQKEPKRLWKRYLFANSLFLLLQARESIRAFAGRFGLAQGRDARATGATGPQEQKEMPTEESKCQEISNECSIVLD